MATAQNAKEILVLHPPETQLAKQEIPQHHEGSITVEIDGHTATLKGPTLKGRRCGALRCHEKELG